MLQFMSAETQQFDQWGNTKPQMLSLASKHEHRELLVTQ